MSFTVHLDKQDLIEQLIEQHQALAARANSSSERQYCEKKFQLEECVITVAMERMNYPKTEKYRGGKRSTDKVTVTIVPPDSAIATLIENHLKEQKHPPLFHCKEQAVFDSVIIK